MTSFQPRRISVLRDVNLGTDRWRGTSRDLEDDVSKAGNISVSQGSGQSKRDDTELREYSGFDSEMFLFRV